MKSNPIACAACLLLLLFTSRAVTQDHRPRIRLLIFSPEDPEATALEHNVRERLNRVPVDLEIQPVDGPSPSQAERAARATAILDAESISMVFYLETGDAPRVVFLLAGDSGPVPLTRRLEGIGELSIGDAVALITLTTVELLLDTESFSPRPNPPPLGPEPATEPGAPPVNGMPPRLFIELEYQLISTSAAPDISHGGILRGVFRFWNPMRVYLSAGGFSPLISRKDGVQLRSSRYPFAVGLTATVRRGRLSFGGSTGIGLCVLRHTVTATTAYDTRAPFIGYDMILDGAAVIEMAVAPRVALIGGFRIQGTPRRVVYEVEGGPVLGTEFRRIWPGVSAGVQFSAL